MATDVNNAGQVVGWSLTPSGNTHAFLYSVGTMLDLGSLGDYGNGIFYSKAYAIDDVGRVVGESSAPGSSQTAFLYANGILQDLRGALRADNRIVAYDINNNGELVGGGDRFGGYSYNLSTGAIEHLGTFGGSINWPAAINDAGHIVGGATVANSEYHAYQYKNGVMTDLGIGAFSSADSINKSGQIVGRVGSFGSPPFYHYNGRTHNLNDLLAPASSGWDLTLGFDNPSPGKPSINDAGQIAATGRYNGGPYRAVLLTPVSEAPRAYPHIAPPPTASISSNLQSEINKRLGQWDQSQRRFLNVTPNDLQSAPAIYVITHGWGKGMIEEFQRTPDAKAWQLYQDPEPGKPASTEAWGAWMEDMAAAIHHVDTDAIVLGYSWIDFSATEDRASYARISRAANEQMGSQLAMLLRPLLGQGYAGEIKMIGHSHGSRTVAKAGLDLKKDGFNVSRLTFLDSPENAYADNFLADGDNTLDLPGDLLDQLKATNGGNGIGYGTGQTFVENYYSVFGHAYQTDRVVNVKLEGHAAESNTGKFVPTRLSNLHAYPYEWYARSARADSNQVGLLWQGNDRPIAHFWKQDWLDFYVGFGYVEDPTRQFALLPDFTAETKAVRLRVASSTLFNQENTIAGPGGALELVEHSPAFADLTLLTEPGDAALLFTYQFNAPGDGDQLGLWINDELRFVMTGWTAQPGPQTASIDISDLTPGLQFLTIALHSYGEANANITVSNLRLVSSFLIGDLNLDGAIDRPDLDLLLAHFGQATSDGYTDGDLNLDGRVSPDDLALFSLYAALNAPSPPPVPEPAPFAVVAPALLLPLARARPGRCPSPNPHSRIPTPTRTPSGSVAV